MVIGTVPVRLSMKQINWDSIIIMTENIDDAWEALLQQFMPIMKSIIIIVFCKNLNTCRCNLLWLTKSLIK